MLADSHTRFRARGIALLVLVLVASRLGAETSATYSVGAQPLGVAFDGADLWVTDYYSNNVTKLMASTGAILGTYSVGTSPDGIVFDGVNIWVANYGGASVTKLLAAIGAVVGTYPVKPGPYALAFDGANIWVSYAAVSNTVTKLLASTGALLGTYSVGSGPYGVAFDGANVWVANIGSNTVTKLLATTGAVVGTYPAGPCPIGVAFDGSNIWVADSCSSSVTKLLASTGATVGNYRVGAGPSGLAFDGINIWVTNEDGNTVTELVAATGAAVGTYPVGEEPVGVTFDGVSVWVANQGDNTVTKISPAAQAPAPSISSAGIVPLYSTASIVQPSEWVSIYGSNLASGTAIWNGNFPTSLGGTSVKINGKPAYLWSVSPGPINLQAPSDTATGTVPVVVTTAGGSATSTATLGQFGPSFLLLDKNHVTGIILRPDGSGAYGGGAYDTLGPTGISLGSRLFHGSGEAG